MSLRRPDRSTILPAIALALAAGAAWPAEPSAGERARPQVALEFPLRENSASAERKVDVAGPEAELAPSASEGPDRLWGARRKEHPCGVPEYRHGISNVMPLRYGPDFTHFAYTNPEAPKGGTMRVAQMGTFDNYNGIVEIGRVPDGYGPTDGFVYDRLLEDSLDEHSSAYVRLADGVAVDPGFRWTAFRLRDGARWHDGRPITRDDVLHTFDAIREHGRLELRMSLADLDRIVPFGEREVCFVTRAGIAPNPILPFVYGRIDILPKHYWVLRDIGKTTTEPPLGSGPYRVEDASFGRIVTFRRVDDYWGRDLPVNRGRFNFERVKWDYFRNENAMFEAHKADVVDIRHELTARNWATAYGFPAARQGLFKMELRKGTRIWGLWWPVFWNLDRPRFRDIRVREALWLLYDFDYVNRVYFHGFFNHGVSLFQNSAMAHVGRPSARELALLEPWRGRIPDRVFKEPFRRPASDGRGFSRENTERALTLFDEAGWHILEGAMVHKETGAPFQIEFIFVLTGSARSIMPFVARLRQLGIETTVRVLDVTHWLYRSRAGSFDGTSANFVPTYMPGPDLEARYGTASADMGNGTNWARIRDPAVDSLIESVNQARTAEDLYAAARALDRVLLWNFYFMPGPSRPGLPLTWWDRFGEVPSEELSRVPYVDAWWWDERKAARVSAGIASLEE